MPTISQPWEVAPSRHLGDRKSAIIEYDIDRSGLVTSVGLVAPDPDCLWTLEVGYYEGDWGEQDKTGAWIREPDLTFVPVGTIRSDPRTAQLDDGLVLPKGVERQALVVNQGWVAPWKLVLDEARLSQRKGEDLIAAMYPQRAEKPAWWDSRLKAAREGSKVENPWATPALDQSKNATTSADSSVAATYTSTPTANDLLLAGEGINVIATTFDSISGWTTDVTSIFDYTDGAGVFSKVSAGSEGTVTATGAGGSMYRGLTIMEFSGMATSSVLDKTAANESASSTTMNSGTTATTSQNDEVCVAALAGQVFAGSATLSGTMDNSFTRLQGYDLGYFVGAIGYRIVTTTGAYTVNQATLESMVWSGAIATYKAAVEVRPHVHVLPSAAVHRASSW